MAHRVGATIANGLAADGGSPPCKYRSLIPSLALLIHLADTSVGFVGTEPLVRACAWGEYLESHAQRVYAPALSPDVTAGSILANRIQRGDLGAEFALREVQQKGWGGLTDRDTIKAALDLLEDVNWVREITEPTGGRPRVRYLVNPQIVGE
ncbi:MAG: hypothetical protein O2954_20865 [bacterium]|nr:hypothetical protein [bacterium]